MNRRPPAVRSRRRRPGFDALDLKPETSTTYELGFRTKSSRFQAVIAGYYVDFKDRIIAFANGSGIEGNPAILQNVGDVRSWGVEAAGTYRVTPELSLFASYAYNNSEYQDDVVDTSGVQPVVIAETAGKTVVNSPRHLAKGEITWDNGTFFARVGANYTSKRYYSYENDAEVGGFVLVDASIGYRLNERISIQANATNLFDKEYVSTIGTNGFANSGDAQTLLRGRAAAVLRDAEGRFLKTAFPIDDDGAVQLGPRHPFFGRHSS